MPVGGDGVPVEVEDVVVDFRPSSRPCECAVAFRMPCVSGMLVVMDEIVVDQDLLRTGNPVIGAEIIVHRNACAAPAGNLHVGYFDVDASEDVDPFFIGFLIAEVRAKKPKS